MMDISPQAILGGARIALDLARARERELEKLRRSAQQVEEIFAKDLVSRMRRLAEPHRKVSAVEALAYDMLDQAIAERMSKTGALGLSQVLVDRLQDRVLASVTLDTVRIESRR